MRWNSFFFLNSELTNEGGNTRIKLKSIKTPPSNKMLEFFDDDLLKLIEKN